MIGFDFDTLWPTGGLRKGWEIWRDADMLCWRARPPRRHTPPVGTTQLVRHVFKVARAGAVCSRLGSLDTSDDVWEHGWLHALNGLLYAIDLVERDGVHVCVR